MSLWDTFSITVLGHCTELFPHLRFRSKYIPESDLLWLYCRIVYIRLFSIWVWHFRFQNCLLRQVSLLLFFHGATGFPYLRAMCNTVHRGDSKMPCGNGVLLFRSVSICFLLFQKQDNGILRHTNGRCRWVWRAYRWLFGNLCCRGGSVALPWPNLQTYSCIRESLFRKQICAGCVPSVCFLMYLRLLSTCLRHRLLQCSFPIRWGRDYVDIHRHCKNNFRNGLRNGTDISPIIPVNMIFVSSCGFPFP